MSPDERGRRGTAQFVDRCADRGQSRGALLLRRGHVLCQPAMGKEGPQDAQPGPYLTRGQAQAVQFGDNALELLTQLVLLYRGHQGDQNIVDPGFPVVRVFGEKAADRTQLGGRILAMAEHRPVGHARGREQVAARLLIARHPSASQLVPGQRLPRVAAAGEVVAQPTHGPQVLLGVQPAAVFGQDLAQNPQTLDVVVGDDAPDETVRPGDVRRRRRVAEPRGDAVRALLEPVARAAKAGHPQRRGQVGVCPGPLRREA